ncbi:MAG TPA: hypothetical protein PK402_11845, partial [Tepidisphaeraceae bacterium]|nr:hypothetical protein [Tepidisphaeraceae bacterium]
FAIECNNEAWRLLESASPSSDEIDRMIHLAHASCFHWLNAGDLLNHLRAQNLLATAYTKANMPTCAVRHAERCLELSREAGEKQTAFDRAMVHGCAAKAFRLAGRASDASKHDALLLDLMKKLESDEQMLVEKLYLSK